MAGKNYMTTGGIMINDIYYADGKSIKGIVGGGGVYALSGIKLWTDDCNFTGNMGADFDVHIKEWWEANGLTKYGLNLCHEHCIYRNVDYREDGTYNEYSIYPDGVAHDSYMFAKPENFLPYAENCKAFYNSLQPNIYEWKKLGEAREKYGFKIMWEIPTKACKPELLDSIKECLQFVDIFSINKPESYDLLGTSTIEESIKALGKFDIPCYFRAGKIGSYMIMDGKYVFGPTIFGPNDIDATGCGNSSTAAAMYAFAEGKDIAMITAMGNATSSVNAQQVGPRPVTTAEIRELAHKLAKEQYDEIKGQVKCL